MREDFQISTNITAPSNSRTYAKSLKCIAALYTVQYMQNPKSISLTQSFRLDGEKFHKQTLARGQSNLT